MIPKRAVLLLALAALPSCKTNIPVDTRAAASIPAEVAIAKLRELLPKAAYLSCNDPRASLMQSEIKSWTVDAKGIEFRTTAKEPYQLIFASIRGMELGKAFLSFEVKVYVATPKDPRKDLYRFNWREEAPARQALELFEALREDR